MTRGIAGSMRGREPSGNERRAAYVNPGLRNARTVWPIASEPYDGAHFAVMPSALVARRVLAGRGWTTPCSTRSSAPARGDGGRAARAAVAPV